MPRVARHVIVRGRVQRVGFRAFAAGSAEAHGVSGWVRNRLDGTVEATGEGDDDAIEAWLADLRRGPRSGLVSSVEVVDAPLERHPGFDVLPTP